MSAKLRRPKMLFLLSTIELVLLLICLVSQCSATTPPQGARKEMNRALNTGVRSLSFDSDDDTAEEHRTPSRGASRPPPPPVSNLFTDDEDEGHGASSSGTSSGTSGRSSIQQRMHHPRSSEMESDADRSFRQQRRLTTSEISSDSSFLDPSDSDQSRSFFDRSVEGEDGETLVGVESPKARRMHGGTPTLGLARGRPKLYSRQGWNKPAHTSQSMLPFTPEEQLSSELLPLSLSPSAEAASFDDFVSPDRGGPMDPSAAASLDELYHSPKGGFNLDRNLWAPGDRRYIKAAKPPPAPNSNNIGVMAVRGRHIPEEFLRAVEYGRKHHHAALSSMKWTKKFISGNSATVFGVELDGKPLILKITQHRRSSASHDDEDPQCVEEGDIRSLRHTSNPCYHQPKRGLTIRAGCSAEPHLVPFEYYIAEKVARMSGLLPAAAGVPNSFAKDTDVWYLMFEELAGISPLKYGENILQRLAKPLIREQLEALEKMATCQIMHLDAHWGNVLYSRERGIQLIDFGIATLVNRFELPDYRAALIVTFTLDRCLDCEGSKLGRSFQELVTKSSYPIQGQALLSHPWLEY